MVNWEWEQSLWGLTMLVFGELEIVVGQTDERSSLRTMHDIHTLCSP